MDPLKCTLESPREILGFHNRHKGIEIDYTKIKPIIQLPPPRNIQELKGLKGRLVYICKFISNMSGRCKPLFRAMKKDVVFEWDQQRREALESINVTHSLSF